MIKAQQEAMLRKLADIIEKASASGDAESTAAICSIKETITRLIQESQQMDLDEKNARTMQIKDMPTSGMTLYSRYKTYLEAWLNIPITQIEQTKGIHLSSHKKRYSFPTGGLLYMPLCAFETSNSVFISCIPEWENELRELLANTKSPDAINAIINFAKKNGLADEYRKFYGLETFEPLIDTSSAVLLDSDHYDQYYEFHKKVFPNSCELVDPNVWMPQEFDNMVRSKVHFCVFECDKIASATNSMCIPNAPRGLINLGIQTVEEHRRKGFATIVCAAFIKHHLQQGLLPMWQCDFDNFASQSLAEKLGFRYLGNVYFVSALTKFWDSM